MVQLKNFALEEKKNITLPFIVLIPELVLLAA